MLSCLTPSDLSTIESYINNFGRSYEADEIPNVENISHVLRVWDSTKSQYLKGIFGNKTILERQVEYCKPITQLRQELCEAVEYGDMSNFTHKLSLAVEKVFGYFDDCYAMCLRLLSSDNLATNTFSGMDSTKEVVFPSGHKITFSNGAKTMRLLRKVCKEFGMEEDFEQFRLAHSMHLNQKKLQGTLCISIHPLDYMTMSDNANGWGSCMSWREDGDYRGGTVEMMNSPCVVVAYLKSNDKKLTWDDKEWNSKLWRTLVVVTPKVITTVKGYPYQHEILAKETVTWLKELAESNLAWNFPYPCQEIFHSRKTYIGEKPYCFDFSTNRMYNDFGTVAHYGYISSVAEQAEHICYSGDSQCVVCGDITTDFYDGNFVVCNTCCDMSGGHYINCEECGDSIYEEDVYWVEDTPLCGYCFNEYAAECALSGEYYFRDNLNTVYLSRVDDCPSKEDNSMMISNFYLTEKVYKPKSWLSRYCTAPPRYDEKTGLYYWNVSDWTSCGLESYWRPYYENI